MPRLIYTQVFGVVVCLGFGIAAASLHHPQGVFPSVDLRQPREAAEQQQRDLLVALEAEAAPKVDTSNQTDSTTGSIRLQPSDYQDDWRQAGTGDGMLGDQLRSHCVRLVNGKLHGRMIVLDPETGRDVNARDITIYFLQKGTAVAVAALSADGRFSVEGLNPGVYGLVVAGADGFAAYSLHVLGDPVPGAQARGPEAFRQVSFLQEEKSSLEIQTLVVPPQNFNALKTLIRNYVPDRVVAVDWLEPDAAKIGAGARSFEVPPGPGALPAGPGDLYYKPTTEREAFPASSFRGHSIRLQPDGSLVGRVRRLHPARGRPLRPGRINVFLLQNDQIVAQVPVETNGTFTVKDFAPGIYSLAAVSRQPAMLAFEGFAAFSINVLPSPKAATATREQLPITTVSFMQSDGILEIDFSLLDYENLAFMRDVANTHLPGGLGGAPGFPGQQPGAGEGPPAPGSGGTPGAPGGPGPQGGAPPGGGSGGGGSGGGGSGGGGALGSFGLIAPIAGFGAAAAFSDQGQPSSPFIP